MSDNSQEDEIIKIGTIAAVLAGGYFLVVRPILNAIGVNADDANTISEMESSTADQNPFALNFGNAYNEQNGNNSGLARLISYNDFTPEEAIGDSRAYDNQLLAATQPDSVVQLVNAAENLRDAFGFFKVDVQKINTVFSTMTSQYEVSQIAQYLNYARGMDLYTELKTGRGILPFAGMRMSGEQLAAILKHVKTLPVYPPEWSY